MKTKEQIKKMIQLCEDLRAVIPSHDAFGGDNAGKLISQEDELSNSLKKSSDQIEDRLMELADQDPMLEDPLVRARVEAIDWVQGDIDDFVTASDVSMWSQEKSSSTKRPRK